MDAVPQIDAKVLDLDLQKRAPQNLAGEDATQYFDTV
jgi:hypothetical protein